MGYGWEQGCHTRVWIHGAPAGGQSLGCGELMAPTAQPQMNQDNRGADRLDVAPFPTAGAPALLLWPRWACHLQPIRLASVCGRCCGGNWKVRGTQFSLLTEKCHQPVSQDLHPCPVSFGKLQPGCQQPQPRKQRPVVRCARNPSGQPCCCF